MNIITQSGEFTKGEIFNLTQGTNLDKVSDHIGEVLELDKWVIYEDEDKDGKIQTVLALIEKNGLLSATISKTFIEQFKKLTEFMDGEEYSIRVVGGTSKNNREYITCEVAL